MKHLVIGIGEIGASLRQILHCDGFDSFKKIKIGEPAKQFYDVIHICFPYGDTFKKDVKAYQELYLNPTGESHTVIHSTVPIGTSDELGAIHSPVRGKHPHLSTSLMVFKKYVAGPGAQAMSKEFKKFDIPAVPIERQADTEAGKLLDLMQYGITILLNKEIKKFCDEHGIDFDIAYTHFNETYNKGYGFMNMPQFIRPNLKHMKGKIGGHCVVPTMAYLDTPSAKKIISDNETL